MERFHSPGQHLCKLIGTKEIVCISKEFNVHRIGLEHQYGRRDVNTLYSDVARFTTHESNLSCNKSVCCRLQKVVAEVESCSTFCKKICTTCARFTCPRQTCFAASHVTPTYSATPAQFFPIRIPYECKMQQPDLLGDRFKCGW